MAKIYLRIWNPDTNEEDKWEFTAREIDELVEMEILDADTIGAAMDDTEAFAKVLEELSEKAYTYGNIAKRYIELTGKDLEINA